MKVTHGRGDPRGLRLAEENARFMPNETFRSLVRQVKADGVLQQWPFVWRDDGGVLHVLSGNHRVKAAIEAGLDEIDWTECDEPLSRDQRTRIQLAHNAIVGEDDPEILRRLFESIADVEERIATGIDDAELDLIFKAATDGLSEVSLDFTTLMIVFLPEEYDRARQALAEAEKMAPADEVWLAEDRQHGRTLDALEDARESAHVMNAATGLGILLDLWDAHRTDLQQNWRDGDQVKVPVTAEVPLATIFGAGGIRAEGAARVAKAVEKMRDRGELETPLDAIVQWAEAYLEEG